MVTGWVDWHDVVNGYWNDGTRWTSKGYEFGSAGVADPSGWWYARDIIRIPTAADVKRNGYTLVGWQLKQLGDDVIETTGEPTKVGYGDLTNWLATGHTVVLSPIWAINAKVEWRIEHYLIDGAGNVTNASPALNTRTDVVGTVVWTSDSVNPYGANTNVVSVDSLRQPNEGYVFQTDYVLKAGTQMPDGTVIATDTNVADYLTGIVGADGLTLKLFYKADSVLITMVIGAPDGEVTFAPDVNLTGYYTVGDTIKLPGAVAGSAVRPGYVLQGWGEYDGTGNAWSWKVSGPKTLYAHWVKAKRYIRYNKNSDEAEGAKTVPERPVRRRDEDRRELRIQR